MLWRLDEVTSKVVLYRNMGFNESGEYKKTFIGLVLGTGSMQVLHEFEFKVEPLGGHTFKAEPQDNVNQRAGLQEMIWMIGQMCMCSATVVGNTVTTVMAITRSIHQATKGLLDKAKGNVSGLEIVRDQNGVRKIHTLAGNHVKEILLKLNLPDHMSILMDSQVTPTKHGRMTKPYSSPRFIANCFNAGYLKMEVKRQSVKVKELQERCIIKAFQVIKSRKVLACWSKVTSAQGGKDYKMAKRDYAWLMISSDEMFPCTIKGKPLALPWGQTPRLDSGVRSLSHLEHSDELSPFPYLQIPGGVRLSLERFYVTFNFLIWRVGSLVSVMALLKGKEGPHLRLLCCFSLDLMAV
nr:hypothetical protein [Tanacetum cinerariifolium]